MIQETYRIWCDTDGKWETVTQDKGVAVPTVCPVDGGHTVLTDRTSLVETDLQPLIGVNQVGANVGDSVVCYGEDDWRCEPPTAASLTHYEVSAEPQVTMSGATWIDLPDMTITPTAGIYYCIFNCLLHSTGSNGLAKFRLNHNGGLGVTERQHEGTDWASETTICIITADGVNPIKVEYSHGGNGNNETRDRIFSIIKIG